MINLIPESSSAPPAARRRYNRRSVLAALVFAFAFPLAIWLKAQGSTGTGALVVFIATLGMLGFMSYEFVRLMISLDELQQRIHLTALAIGFGGSALAVSTLGLSVLFFLDGSGEGFTAEAGVLALPLGLVLYYVSLHVLLRRYR